MEISINTMSSQQPRIDPKNPVRGCQSKWGKFVPSDLMLRRIASQILALFLVYATMWGVLGQNALPGSEIFAFFLLIVCCHIGGLMVTLVKLPALIGMLIVGFLFRNITYIPYYQDISNKWAAIFRNVALVIILLRAGLGLDPLQLRKMSMVCLRLAFMPCLMEAITAGVASHFLLNLPWSMSFSLGFVLSAVSPAVVIPSMLLLNEKGYGQEKGITTILIAASSIDDVFSIAGFGLSTGIAFSKGNLIWTVVKGPLEVLVGLAYGGVVGIIFWYFPHPSENRKMLYRVILLTFGGLGVMFVSQMLNFAASGALGCLSLAFVAALRWRAEDEKVADVQAGLWQLFQTFLFGLIGAEVSTGDLQKDVGYGMLVLLIALVFRLVVSYCALFRSGLSMKEKVFVAFAWLPKATVQAAIGSVALDLARSADFGEDFILYGKQILTIAVLSILLTAPVGAIAIALLGPMLLNKTSAQPEWKQSSTELERGEQLEEMKNSHLNCGCTDVAVEQISTEFSEATL